MGNISSMARASTALDSYVAELGNDISYDKSLSSSRFLKTILARHAYGPLVLKIFIKPDVAMSLRPIQRRLKAEREALADMQSVHSYQTFVETDKAGYLIRQWAGANLYDRVSIQPYLAGVEKKWIAFQLLTCLRDARTRKVGHGDIKSENVLVASDLSVMLTDFSSSFKPVYLPLDDPSEFSFFFDTSSRRTCYIAPERFYSADSKQAKEKGERGTMALGEGIENRDGRVTEEMDVFSCGCVLAELWTDGRAVFNLSELFAYRGGTLELDALLDNIDDPAVRNMISQMLARDPQDRPSFDRILSTFRGSIFPEYFYTFLKDYAASLSELPEPSQRNHDFIKKVASQPGTKVDRLLDEWESISIHLDKGVDENGPALLLLNMVTSSVRNCIWPSSRLHGLQLFLNLCPFTPDEDRIDRILPFVVELLSDEVAIVRAEACRVLVQVVESVTSITPQNSTYIPEYLLPQTRHLASDPDVYVRSTYARALVHLADAAVNMLELSQASKPSKSDLEASGVVEPDYDSMLVEIQAVVEEQATTLLVDPSSQVKRAFIASIADLCLFFGRQKSNETVLSHIMTYLNDRDWLLRLAFFDGIVDVGAFIGIRAVEEYVLPLMLQALADPEEAVVARVIASLTSLTSLGLLPRMKLWDVFFAIRGFLCHPDSWIRQGTAGFIAAAARKLPRSDVWCILYPSLRTLLHSDVAELDETSIISALIPPLSRNVLISAKAAALHNTPAGFWDVAAHPSFTKATLMKSADAVTPIEDATSPRTGSKQAEKLVLQDKGFTAADEKKIVALKDFIVKQAHNAKAREHHDTAESAANSLVTLKSVSLTDLGVTPQTVFISPRTIGVDAKADLKRLRPLLGDTGSRRTSMASRSNRGTADNPVDELRKRLATMETPTKTPERNQASTSEQPVPSSEGAPSESAISSTLDLSAIPRTGKKRTDTKGAPAVAAIHTNAIGTTTIHDEPASGRSTPTPLGLGLGSGRSVTPRPAPYASSYEGHDPGVRAFLEQVDLENYREPLLDFGPRVSASHRKRAPRPKTSNNPQGVTLIGHLTHHTDNVVSIVTSPDQVFFATASEDCTVLIWDSAKLERSIACEPRRVYTMDSPVTAMCRIENTHCLAVASEDGQVHVLRIHVTTTGGSAKYGQIKCIRDWRTSGRDGHVKFMSHLQDSTLLLVTTTSLIARLDIRTMEITARLQHPLEYGVITAIRSTPHWIAVGTSTGTISIWDLRFGLIAKSWTVTGRITSLQLHPARGKGLWLMVSTVRSGEETPLVRVYDIETSKLVEMYEARTTKPVSRPSPDIEASEPVKTKADLIAELASRQTISVDQSSESESEPVHSVLAMMVGQSFASLVTSSPEAGLLSVPERSTQTPPGWMVSAGDDRVVRYWDLVKVSESMIVCGSQKERDVSFKHNTSDPALYYTLPNPSRPATAPSRHAGIAQHTQPLRPHYDAIAALSAVETPFSSCVISGDRSGIVKVWRMEGQAKP